MNIKKCHVWIARKIAKANQDIIGVSCIRNDDRILAVSDKKDNSKKFS